MSEHPEDPGRAYAVAFNTLAWDLLGRSDRGHEDDLKMLHAAHASLLHWLGAGAGAHHQRGLWLIARVYAELGLAKRRCATPRPARR